MEEFDVIKKYQPPAQKRRHGEPVANSQPQPIPDNERFIPFVDQVFGGQLASMLICSSCKKVSVCTRSADQYSSTAGVSYIRAIHGSLAVHTLRGR